MLQTEHRHYSIQPQCKSSAHSAGIIIYLVVAGKIYLNCNS